MLLLLFLCFSIVVFFSNLGLALGIYWVESQSCAAAL